MGEVSGGNGTVNLSGAASRWEDAFGVAIGALGNGHLLVSAGGTYLGNGGSAIGRAMGSTGSVLLGERTG